MHKSLVLNNISTELLNSLKDASLTSVFLSPEDLVSKTNTVRSHLNGVKVFTKLDIFSGQPQLKKFPDALAVEVTGKDTNTGSYTGLCPTHEGLRENRLQRIRELCAQDIDGLWLDNMRYPSIWDLDEPTILDTCYCERCLKLFDTYIGEPVEGATLEDKYLHIDGSYYHEWLEFKALQINTFVADVKKIIKESGKSITLGLFVVPWEDKEYGAGIKRIVAQDLGKLLDVVDVYSPMLNFHSMGKSVDWVKYMVEYYWSLGINFLPYLKFANTIPENKLSQATIMEACINATASPSSGLIVDLGDTQLTQKEIIDIVHKLK